jgi:hypothetical protein
MLCTLAPLLGHAQCRGASLPDAYTLAVQVLVAAGVLGHSEALQAISAEASQEAALEELLARVVGRWAGLEFEVMPFRDSKDILILGGLEDVQVGRGGGVCAGGGGGLEGWGVGRAGMAGWLAGGL